MKLHLRLFLVLAALVGLFAGTNCSSSQTVAPRYISNQQNTTHLMNSVVALVISNPLGGRQIGCSGFFVSPTQIVTAEHCVETHEIGITVGPDGEPNLTMNSTPPTTNMEVEYVTYADWRQWQAIPNGIRRPSLTTHTAHVLRWDEDNDVAVLTTSDISTNWLPMRTTVPSIGERVYTVSQPGRLIWMFSEGIISQIESVEGRTFIMATPPIYMGSSGCPLIDNNGQVVGIADAIAYRQPSFGLFVPIARAQA